MKIHYATAVAALLLLAPASASAAANGGPAVQGGPGSGFHSANTRLDPGSSPAPPLEMQDSSHCPLTRIGTQFVRCDILTGAGVDAPAWVPELYPGN